MMKLRSSPGGVTAYVVPGSPVNGRVAQWPFLIGCILILEALVFLVIQPILLVADIVLSASNPIETCRAHQNVRRNMQYMCLALELLLVKELSGGWDKVSEKDITSAFESAKKLEKTWWWTPDGVVGVVYLLIPACGEETLRVIRHITKTSSYGAKFEAPRNIDVLKRHVDSLPVKESVKNKLKTKRTEEVPNEKS